MFNVEITVGDATLSGRIVTHSPTLAKRVRAALPTKALMVQEQWSGAFLASAHGLIEPSTDFAGPFSPYQHPGRVYLEPSTGRISICYGQGRLLDAYEPLRVMALADLDVPEADLAAICSRAQFDGPMEFTIREAGDSAPIEQPVPDLTITLVGASAHVCMLDAAPTAVRSLLEQVPLEGTATNTHSSGPLVRFWNPSGGTEGITPLELPEDELAKAQAVLYPGHVYYLPKPTHAGFRITTRQAAIMRSPSGGPGLKLVPIAKMVGDYQDFVDIAESLRMTGQQPMTIGRYQS